MENLVLLAILPTYLAVFVPGLYALIDVQVLPLLRVFRVFKLTHYILCEYTLYVSGRRACGQSAQDHGVSLGRFDGGHGDRYLMYVIEGPKNGFTSIPMVIYWEITTMTTVGFGDITPENGYRAHDCLLHDADRLGVLAVPTGIVTAEMSMGRRQSPALTTSTCKECLTEGLGPDDLFCQHCGVKLTVYKSEDGVG